MSNTHSSKRSTVRILRFRAAIVLCFTIAAHLILDLIYRPWATQREFQDLGLAGSFTQVTSVVGISALMVLVESDWLWQEKWYNHLLTWTPVISMLSYEILQLWLPWGTFDTVDIVWTLAGGLLAGAISHIAYNSLMRRAATLV